MVRQRTLGKQQQTDGGNETMTRSGAHAGKKSANVRQSDLALQVIWRAIARCELMPGTMVSEADLEKSFGLRRAATRSALERLSVYGLVHPVHRRGYQIKPITLRDVNDLYQMREIVERAAVRLAVGRVDQVSLRRLDKICAEGYTPYDRGSEECFLQANTEFHLLIATATGNDRLVTAIQDIHQEMERILHFGLAFRNRTDEMRHEHGALITALTEGDAEGAEGAILDELASSKAMVMDALMSAPSLLDVNIIGFRAPPESNSVVEHLSSGKSLPATIRSRARVGPLR
ncbi:GntR family transcriptional regulator [Faunimonas sp. B44]|uniref:GntR family transcriptional regulator n=1 Tax=Faunimonas sp. B44 TaxID=3461493 RepID=UPI0040444571